MMKSETLVQHHPPTPPSAAELQYGLHHVAQHNSDRHFAFDGSQLQVSPSGASDAAIREELLQQTARQPQHGGGYPESHGQEFGLGIQYEGYGQSGSYYSHEGQYNDLPNNSGLFPWSPPTPRSDTEDDGVRRSSSSSHPIIPSSSSPIMEDRKKSVSNPKKAKANKLDKPKAPKLTVPLSILTKDMTSIPVRNMEEWVNRPPEVRRKEVEKRDGYVTRPMNSFMLYRSAYAERTKQWCLQNNHQVISSVSGKSWPLEPPEVREMYNEYAKIERINHQNAHPTYKFSPSKVTATGRKRKGEYSEDEEPSDLEDAEWNTGTRRHSKSVRRPERGAGYPVNGTNGEFFDRGFGPNSNGMNRSAWEMTNEGRPLPLPMAHNGLYEQYYPANVHPNMAMQQQVMEDLRLCRVDTPVSAMHLSPGHSLLGLPGGDLIQQLHPQAGTPMEEQQVDPMLLLPFNRHGEDAELAQHPDFRNGHMGMMERDLDQSGVHDLLGGNPPHESYRGEPSWQADPAISAPLEQGSEFDMWME